MTLCERLVRHIFPASLLASALALGPAPAEAQMQIGESGFRVTLGASLASDYVSRGISQTRSRPGYQATAELSHDSGFYIGAAISNVRFAYTDARQEVDVSAGYRFSLPWDIAADVGIIGTFYPGYSVGRNSNSIDYGEGFLRLSRDFGDVTALASINVSPNFFDASGFALYIETGLDWDTGLWNLTLGPRLGYQWVQKNQRFGAPDYAWWGVVLSRQFELPGAGTATVSLGYVQSSISRNECLTGIGTRQNICGARVVGQLTLKF